MCWILHSVRFTALTNTVFNFINFTLHKPESVWGLSNFLINGAVAVTFSHDKLLCES